MSRILKRYCFCSIVILIIILIIYYKNFGRNQIDQAKYVDEFIAVAYINEDEDSEKNDLTLRANDNGRLVNLTNFRYTIQPNVCDRSNDDVLAILLVTSYVGHDEVRSAHRTAISGSVLRNLKILRVFLLAQVPLHEKFITQSAIEDESQYFNDIVQGNFLEAYRNLTYKHVMGLRWASSHYCLNSKFIIKMDDDIVVDLFHLVNYLNDRKFDLIGKEHFLAGYVFRNVVPIRAKQNKWYVSYDEYDGNIYPDYLSGWMYVTTLRTAKSLVQLASKRPTKFFWIDDTWITGVLRSKLNISINESFNSIFSANSEFLDCCIDDIKMNQYKCSFIAGPNGGDHKLIQKFMLAIHDRCYNNSTVLATNYCHTRPSDKPSIKKTCVGSDKHLLKENHGAAIISAIKL